MKYKNYIDTEELYSEFIKSKEQNSITPELQEIFDFMIYKFCMKFPWVSQSGNKEIYIWRITKQLKKCWFNYNPELNKNPFPYYTEILKTLLVSTYRSMEKFKEEYRVEVIVKSRKPKLEKIFSI